MGSPALVGASAASGYNLWIAGLAFVVLMQIILIFVGCDVFLYFALAFWDCVYESANCLLAAIGFCRGKMFIPRVCCSTVSVTESFQNAVTGACTRFVHAKPEPPKAEPTKTDVPCPTYTAPPPPEPEFQVSIV